MALTALEEPQVRERCWFLQKGEVLPVLSMKAYRGRRGIAPLTLNLGTTWM
jgi:hypothetical protein